MMFKLTMLMVCVAGCEKNDATIHYYLENNTKKHIEFLLPVKYNYAVPFLWGTMQDLSPNDTTSKSAWRAHFERIHLLPNTQGKTDTGYKCIEEMAPYDTVRVFVFDAGYAYLGPPDNNPDPIFESENYLCRYDFSVYDIYHLTDSSGNFRISFPPSEKMKEVKMFPPYKEVISVDD